MLGYIDLHCHFIPQVDDGVKSLEEGMQLCHGLYMLGFSKMVATPHIRSRRYDNTPDGLRGSLQKFQKDTAHHEELPEFGLAAEYYVDELTWAQIENGKGLYYPGGHAVLVEFPTLGFPFGIAQRFNALKNKGMRVVLAHPERYRPILNSVDAIDPLLKAGALPLLDLMALVGRYGREIQQAAEQLLKADKYFAACSDTHHATDVPDVERSIERLQELVGEAGVARLLKNRTAAILSGNFSD